MQTITTIGLNIAKSVFQVHGVDAAGQVVVRRQLRRRYVLPFFQKLPLRRIGENSSFRFRAHSGNDFSPGCPRKAVNSRSANRVKSWPLLRGGTAHSTPTQQDGN
jgi:hypothetical protein